MVKLLCYFMHRLLDFRHTEIQSLASLTEGGDLHQVTFEAPFGGSYLSPFWYARLTSEACARKVAARSMLLKVKAKH